MVIMFVIVQMSVSASSTNSLTPAEVARILNRIGALGCREELHDVVADYFADRGRDDAPEDDDSDSMLITTFDLYLAIQFLLTASVS